MQLWVNNDFDFQGIECSVNNKPGAYEQKLQQASLGLKWLNNTRKTVT